MGFVGYAWGDKRRTRHPENTEREAGRVTLQQKAEVKIKGYF